MVEKQIPMGEDLLRIAAQKFLVWASRLDETEAATVKSALDLLNVAENTPAAAMLAGFFGGVQAGLEMAREGGNAE